MNEISFQPEWTSEPGETLCDVLHARDISRAEFAKRLRKPVSFLNEVISGARAIDLQTAMEISDIIGPSPTFWLSRQSIYERDLKFIAKKKADIEISLWLKSLPLKDMNRWGSIKTGLSVHERLEKCLHFFGVNSLEDWHRQYDGIARSMAFKSSETFASALGPLAAWMRQGELKGLGAKCRPWNIDAFASKLQTFRAFTRRKDTKKMLEELKQLCADCGVALVILQAPKGCRASGGAKFIAKDKALLMLSLRHRTDDHFWFTFFHEAGHLILHDQSLTFVDTEQADLGDMKEKEANEFAARTLIPDDKFTGIVKVANNWHELARAALRAGISPGIAVGQLQRNGVIAYKQLNFLKKRSIYRTFARSNP